MMGLKEIYIQDRKFRELIPEMVLQERIDELAARINSDFAGREVVFVGILNGAFMFAADLFRRIDLRARITFIKLASYAGTSSTGNVRELIGWNEDLGGRQVIIVDDIVDRGDTLEYAVNNLIIRNVTDIKVAALLLKPGIYRKNIRIDYTGFEIPNDFVAGYGLDYNGFGRNLTSVYSLVD